MNISSESIELSSRKIVQEYQGMVAWPVVSLAVGILISFITVCILSLSRVTPLWLGLVANSLLLYAAYTPLHEACHNNIAGKDRQLMWLNHLVGFMSGVILMHDYRALRRLHLIHHRDTNDKVLDPDRWVKVKNPLVLVFRCFTIVPFYFWYFFQHVVFKWKNPGNMSLSIYVLGMYSVLISLVVAIGIAGYWTEVLLLWVGPHWIGSAIIIYLFAYIPHKPCDTKDRYLNARIHSIGGRWEWLSNVIYLFQNYHLIHHLFPRIPFYLYPAAFGELRPLLKQKGARIEEQSDSS